MTLDALAHFWHTTLDDLPSQRWELSAARPTINKDNLKKRHPTPLHLRDTRAIYSSNLIAARFNDAISLESERDALSDDIGLSFFSHRTIYCSLINESCRFEQKLLSDGIRPFISQAQPSKNERGCHPMRHPLFSFPTNRRKNVMEVLHTVEAIAPQFNLSTQAVYAACRNGQIPHIRIGKRIRIPESSIQKWIDAQTSKNNDAQESENSYQAVN